MLKPFSRRAALTCVVLAGLAGAPAAEARDSADAAKVRPAKLKLERLGSTPASIQAGRSFRARGRVANRRARKAQRGRLTFSLRKTRAARRGIRLRRANLKRVTVSYTHLTLPTTPYV